jgi:hypothetical protein
MLDGCAGLGDERLGLLDWSEGARLGQARRTRVWVIGAVSTLPGRRARRRPVNYVISDANPLTSRRSFPSGGTVAA